MMIWKSIATILMLLTGAGAEAQTAPPALAGLLAEERRLAEAAATLAPPEAIASLLADDARVHARGGPYRGRAAALEALKTNPSNAGNSISFRSIKSGVSGDGSHGFTLGYLTIAGGDPKTADRRYLAYWVKGADGWRVAALKQALRQQGEAELASLPISVPLQPGAAADAPAARASLVAAEKSFSDRAQVAGLGRAFTEYGRADAINSGPDGIKVGAAAIGAAVSGGEVGPSPVEWSADEALVAPSGDLGITFGMIRSKSPAADGPPGAVPYFTIWMRDGPDQPWRYVAE